MSQYIENITFNRFVNQEIPFEFISIKELYARCKKSAYDLSNPHRIEFHALIVITKGKSNHSIDFEEQTIFPGVILPVTKGQVHAFNQTLEVDGFVISFDESFISQNIGEKNLFHFLHLFHNPRIVIQEENLPSLDPFLQLLEQIHQEANTTLKSEMIHSILLATLLQIKRLCPIQDKLSESQRFKDFIQFKQLIARDYKESHNAKEYAKKLFVSYKYLNDICKELSNQTAKAFIDSWLMLEIKRNISENKYTSQEIAYKMGFQEPSNFIRFFKKFTGITPFQFQKQITHQL